MKKKFVYHFLFLLMISVYMTGCFSTSIDKEISRSLSIELPLEVTIHHKDDHGGFHGDGVTIANVQFEDGAAEDFLSQIQRNIDWKPTPLSENIKLELYGGEKGNTYYSSDLAVQNEMPEDIKGYWVFIDRYDSEDKITNGEELFSRSSKNYTLGIYDTEKNKLYYYQYDS